MLRTQAAGVPHDTYMRDLKEVDRAILEGAGDGAIEQAPSCLGILPVHTARASQDTCQSVTG